MHVVDDMNTLTPPRGTPIADDPHQKTIDLRADRLRELTALTEQVGMADTDGHHIDHALSRLIESKAFVTAHALTLLEQIVASLPLPQQDAEIRRVVRPHTEAVDAATVAIARLRHRVGARR